MGRNYQDFLLLAMAAPVPVCHSWSSQRQRLQFLTNKSALHYQQGDEELPKQSQSKSTETPQVDVSFLESHKANLEGWLCSLEGVQRSSPMWVGTELLTSSPSEILQQCLNNLDVLQLDLFDNNESAKRKFDWDWRYALIQGFCQHGVWDEIVAKQAMSNTHPLRWQVVAIPPHTSLKPHVHPAVELDIPLVGSLYEDRIVKIPDTMAHTSDVQQSTAATIANVIDASLLDRAPEHSLGTPLSDFSFPPTADELQLIAKDLSHRVSEAQNSWQQLAHYKEENCVQTGHCLVNTVGSIHRSFTRDEPCLLFVLGPNVHAHFVD